MRCSHPGHHVPSRALLRILLFVAIIGVAPACDAEDVGAQATSAIGFLGSSSLHEWEGKAAPIHTALHASALTGDWSGDLVIPVATLDSGNATRDARMRAMFHADRFPDIRVALRGVDPAVVARTFELIVPLTIGDVTREVRTNIRGWKREDGRVSFDANAVVSLQAFGLEAPSVLGLVRVADEVKVQAHVDVVVFGDHAPGDFQGPAKPSQAGVPE